jgi:hypothetical protein
MLIPARKTRCGGSVPAFVIDREFAVEVRQHSWRLIGKPGHKRLSARVNGRVVSLHRFLWHLRHGEWPRMLDHISRDPLDNRLSNLRLASHSLNQLNKRTRGKRGLPQGVHRDDRGVAKKYQAMIRWEGKTRCLGQFATAAEASAVYEAERARLLAAHG